MKEKSERLKEGWGVLSSSVVEKAESCAIAQWKMRAKAVRRILLTASSVPLTVVLFTLTFPQNDFILWSTAEAAENFSREFIPVVSDSGYESEMKLWSTVSLLNRNVSSMLVVPEHVYQCDDDGRSPPFAPCPISFFVYDDLPANLSSDLEQWVQTSGRRLENMLSELALVRLFRTSPCRTANSSAADLFIVPYMHTAHCVRHPGYQPNCGNVPASEIDRLLASLRYFTRDTQARHTFILGWGHSKSNSKLNRMPLQISPGWKRRRRKIPLSQIIIPPMNLLPTFQPSMLKSHNADFWTRPRQYSLTAFIGGENKRMPDGPRRYRTFFLSDVGRHTHNNSLGGLPMNLNSLSGGKNSSEVTRGDIYEAYHDSIFCPVLPGDSAWQRRFFDVAMSGCLPLVIEWNVSKDDSISWHTPRSDRDVKNVYPFFPGGFYDSDVTNINYASFVLTVPGNTSHDSDFGRLFQMVEDLILNKPGRVREMQLSLMREAPKLAFGLGIEAHRHHDMFWRVLQAMGQYYHHRLAG